MTECFRVDARGKVVDTQYRLVSRESADDDNRDESRPKKKLERVNETTREQANQARDSGPSYDWSRAPWSGGSQSNWQREYRLQHPD